MLFWAKNNLKSIFASHSEFSRLFAALGGRVNDDWTMIFYHVWLKKEEFILDLRPYLRFIDFVLKEIRLCYSE